jgi:DNA-binding FadR family transcriptional regulator
MQLFRMRGAMKPQYARTSMELHVGTLDAILAGNKDRAFQLFNDHLEMGRSYVLTGDRDTESE